MPAAPDRQLTVLGRTARRGDEVVAELTYGGMITVRLPDGAVIGRLLRTGKHTRCYDAWTAVNQYVPTPSDRQLAESLMMDAAVALLLGRAAAAALTDDGKDATDG